MYDKFIQDSDGYRIPLMQLTGSNEVQVNSSALPTGASTEAKQDAIIAELQTGLIPPTTVETTHQEDASDGNGTVATISGCGDIVFSVFGTFDSAVVTVEASTNGTNYEAIAVQDASTGLVSSNISVAGNYKGDVGGFKYVRAVISGSGASTSLTVQSLAVGIAKSPDRPALVQLSGSNKELLTKTTITWDGAKLADSVAVPLGSGSPVLITILNAPDQAIALNITLEHQIEEGVWVPYADGLGSVVTWTVSANGGAGVYGVIQGFPRFLGGRVVLTGDTAPTSTKITTVQVQEV